MRIALSGGAEAIMRLVHTLLGIALLGAACETPVYTPASCRTDADCAAGRACLHGFCTPPRACGNGRCDGGEGAWSCPSDCDGVTCGDGTCDPGETPGSCPDCAESRTYVFSTMDAESPADVTLAFGFDLDAASGGRSGLPCTAAPDFSSVVTGQDGVDNQLSTVLPTLSMMLPGGVNGAIQEDIQRGALLYIIEVSGIESFVDDPVVRVHGVMGRPLPGAPVVTDGDGLAPGQTFATMIDLGTVPGAITNGRLSVSELELPLTFTANGETVRMDIRHLVIGGRLSATGELTDGEIGGSVSVEDAVVLGQTFFAGIDRATIEAFAMPDLDPDETGEHCHSISAGMGFESVSATLVE